jgi:hypothetical protein
MKRKNLTSIYNAKLEKYKLYVTVAPQSPGYMLPFPPARCLTTSYTDWLHGAAVTVDRSGHASKRGQSGGRGLETGGL